MERTYISALEPGKNALEGFAGNLRDQGLQVNQVTPYPLPGAAAMVPKLILNPSHAGHTEERLLETIGKRLYVFEVTGSSEVEIVTQKLRNRLGLNTPDLRRVHVAKNEREIGLVDYAKNHTSQEVATHIKKISNISDYV